MKKTLDAFEQSIEDNAEKFVPLSDVEKTRLKPLLTRQTKPKTLTFAFQHTILIK